MILENGETINLDAALYGMAARVYYDHGTQSIDLESWVSEHMTQAVFLNVGSITISGYPVTHAYGGAGDDLIRGDIHDDLLKGYGGD